MFTTQDIKKLNKELAEQGIIGCSDALIEALQILEDEANKCPRCEGTGGNNAECKLCDGTGVKLN